MDIQCKKNKVFNLKHDIYTTDRITNEPIIIDTKYKILSDKDTDNKISDVSQQDMYQMLAYGIRRRCNNIHMIYPELWGSQEIDNISQRYMITDEFSRDNISIKVHRVPIYLHDCYGDYLNRANVKKTEDNLISCFYKILF